MLVLIAGCVVPVDSEADKEIIVEDEAGMPDYSGDSGRTNPCASIYDIVNLNGQEIVVEIPVECHPLDLPIFWWGPDDYYEQEDPMEGLVIPNQTQTQQNY
jgi:hypothetical protein